MKKISIEVNKKKLKEKRLTSPTTVKLKIMVFQSLLHTVHDINQTHCQGKKNSKANKLSQNKVKH